MAVPASPRMVSMEEVAKHRELEVFLDAQDIDTDQDSATTTRRASCSGFGRRLARGSLFCALGLAGMMAFSALRSGHGSADPAWSSVKSPVNLELYAESSEGMADVVDGSLGSASTVVEPRLKGLFSVLRKTGADLEEKVKRHVKFLTSVERNASNTSAMRMAALQKLMNGKNPLKRSMDTHDGNVCADDEELLGKLCYKLCRNLTNGEYPVRTTAFTCCKSEPCGVFNQRMSLKVCGGFDVAGDSHSNACPHVPGACLGNEELHLGMCYKKCSLLTDFDFPYRVAAATCCKIDSEVLCVDPPLHRISPDYNVGGGDAADPDSPAEPHWPIPTLTEESQPEAAMK